MMTARVKKLRDQSLKAVPSISGERARLITEFYKSPEAGRVAPAVAHALAFKHILAHKTIVFNAGELIVGERGHAPKATPTYPEVTCHSAEDLRILDSRPKTSFKCDARTIAMYEKEIIPFWRGRSIRDRMMAELPEEWKAAYGAGVFTEFMEQRAPGHTVLDDKIYRKGMLDFIADIDAAIAKLDFLSDPEALDKREELTAMRIAAEALILFARRHADKARELAAKEKSPERKREFLKIAEVCERVPAHAPRNFWEALQAYWFVHLGVITEYNTWDSFNPGRLDQHLWPFYKKGLEDGSLSRETAAELLQCFWVKFNNQPAPPKVGVTAEESGTYTDFALINVGGLKADGSDARQRPVLPHPRRHRGDAAAAAQLHGPGLGQGAGCLPLAGPQDRPDRVRPALDLQHRRHRQGAGPAGQELPRRPRRRGQRLCRVGRLRQGELHPDRVLQHSQGLRADPSQRLRSARTKTQLGPKTGDSGFVQDVRTALRRVQDAAAAFHRRQDRRERHHRAALRHGPARAVPFDPDRRLRGQGPRLPRRRGPLQQQLHPGRRAGLDHRHPGRRQDPRLRAQDRVHEEAPGGPGRRFRRPRGLAPDAAPQVAQVRQRRGRRRRPGQGRLRGVFRGHRRPAHGARAASTGSTSCPRRSTSTSARSPGRHPTGARRGRL